MYGVLVYILLEAEVALSLSRFSLYKPYSARRENSIVSVSSPNVASKVTEK